MDGQVTEERSSQEASHAEADALFNSIGDGAIMTDEKARIRRVNKTALQILGYSEGEMLGAWFPQIILAEDDKGNQLSNLERPIAQVFLTGKSISTRTVYIRKDSSRVNVSLNIAPIINNSKPVGAIEVFRDITDEIALERAKEEFVAIASHQLRTPATAVKQYVGLLLDGYAEPLTENQKFFMERAYESNERQLQIIQEILRITQLDLDRVILRLAETDIRKIASDAVSPLNSKFKQKNQKVIIKVPKEPLVLNVDKEQIQVALENLLENASNYTWENKSITVTVSKKGQEALISVKDHGVGIDSQDIPKLFQKFSRIPNPLSLEVSGTGLGLYWAGQIVKLHGGYIKVSSAISKGSTFTICLPLNK